MDGYAVSTNLISWVPAKKGIFGWPVDGPEGELVRTLNPGDYLVPKFSQAPDYRRTGSQADYVREICSVLELDYEEERADYETRVANGQGAVPFLMRVTARMEEDSRFSGADWARVAVEVEPLEHPLSTSEFLRLQVLPVELARQFKAAAARGRHIQPLPVGSVEAIKAACTKPERTDLELRR